MSYSCPDCKDGTLEAKVREIELEEGETAEIVGGVVIATKVGCDNGCSSEPTGEDHDHEIEACGKDGCTRSKGHRGRHKLPQSDA
jgi:hypothetical protein